MSRRLALAARQAPDAGGDALRALAVALAPHLQQLLLAQQHDQEFVDVLGMLPAPERKPGGKERHRVGIERAALRACRSGAIEGASKVGRRWLAPRSAVLTWLRSQGPRPVISPADQGDGLDALRARLATPRRSRRTG